jgi:hypothetical protein
VIVLLRIFILLQVDIKNKANNSEDVDQWYRTLAYHVPTQRVLDSISSTMHTKNEANR